MSIKLSSNQAMLNDSEEPIGRYVACEIPEKSNIVFSGSMFNEHNWDLLQSRGAYRNEPKP